MSKQERERESVSKERESVKRDGVKKREREYKDADTYLDKSAAEWVAPSHTLVTGTETQREVCWYDEYVCTLQPQEGSQWK